MNNQRNNRLVWRARRAAAPPARPRGPAQGAARRFSVPRFRLDEKQHQVVRRFTPYPDPAQTQRFATHTHPVLNITRALAEEYAYKELRRLVKTDIPKFVDIGGNPTRHYRYGRDDIHSCNPILDARDEYREQQRRGSALHQHYYDRYCHHLVQDCSCVAADAYLSVHSLYYLDPIDILDLLFRCTSGRMFAVVHFHDGLSGHFGLVPGHPPESSWERHSLSDREEIRQTTNSELYAYVHPAMDWLRHPHFTYEDRSMAWSVEQRIGDHVVLQFIRCLRVLDPVGPDLENPPRFEEVIRANDYYGPLARLMFTENNIPTVMDQYDVTIESIYSLGPNFAVSLKDRDTKIRVPKAVVEAVAFQLSGKVRDPHNLQAAFGHARNYLAQRTNLCPTQMVTALPVAAILGFVTNLDLECSLVQNRIDTDKLTAHEKTMTFASQTYRLDFWRDTKLQRLVMAAAAAYIILKLVYSRRSALKFVAKAVLEVLRPGLFTANMFAIPWYSLPLASLVPSNLYSVISSLFVISLVKVRGTLVDLYSHFTGRSKVEHHQPIIRSDVCLDHDGEYDLHPSAKLRVPDTTPVNCDARVGTVQYGPAVPYRVPTVARNCLHNMILSLKGRALKNRAKPSPGVWQDIKRHLSTILGPCLRNQCDCPVLDLKRGKPHPQVDFGKILPADFEEWLARFPTAKRDVMRRALDRIRSGVVPSGYWKFKTFMKREKVCKNTPLLYALYDPRTIQGLRPEGQVISGPWTYAVSKFVAQAWSYRSYKPRRITYAAGMNANDVGSWFDTTRAMLIDPVIAETDASRWDSNLDEDALEAEKDFYTDILPAAMHLLQRLLEEQVNTEGVTLSGVEYSVDGTRKSGQGQTSVGNSKLNGAVNDRTLQRGTMLLVERHLITPEFALRILWYILVMGDDILINIEREIITKLGSWYLRELSTFGLVVKAHIFSDPYEAEFCSGRFYPSSKGTVFGPKIGRILSRTFHSLKHYSERKGIIWAHSVAIGLKNDVNHIPVLRKLIARVLAVTEGLPVMPIPKEEHKIHVAEPVEVVPATYEMLEHVYGLDRYSIDSVERFFDNIKQATCTISHPVLERIVNVDVPMDDKPRKSLIALLDLLPANVFHLVWDRLRRSFSDLVRKTTPHLLRLQESLATWFEEHVLQNNVVEPELPPELRRPEPGVPGMELEIAVQAEGAVAPNPTVLDQLDGETPGMVAFQLVYAIMVAPRFEEWFKRLHPMMCHLLVFFETRNKIEFLNLFVDALKVRYDLPIWGSSLMFGVGFGCIVVTARKHYDWAAMPYEEGVRQHTRWNTYSMIFSIGGLIIRKLARNSQSTE